VQSTQNKLVVAGLVIVGVLIPLALAVPFTRAWILAASIVAVAWMVLLPRGWFSQADHPTRQILTVFLLARVAMVVVFEVLGQGFGDFIGGGSDSREYTRIGEIVSSQLEVQGVSSSHRETPGTGSVDLFVGYLFWIGAPVRTAASFLWASMATIGLLLFWTSTKHLVAERLHLYTAAVLLLPTLLFWNSGVGKEAPLILGTGAMVAGIFYVAERGMVGRGISYFAFGSLVTGLVRPHVTFLIIVSAAVGIGLASRRASAVSLGRRVVTLGIVGIALVAIVPVTLQLIDPSGTRSFVDAANKQTEKTAAYYQSGDAGAGESTFVTSTAQTPFDVPRAIVTVLFRPFPWEVRSVTQALASLEAAVLGLASIWAGWSVLTGRAKFMRTPLTMTALTYVVLFSVAFVSLGNFGLLVRQRMQVVAFLVLVLFSVRVVSKVVNNSTSSSPNLRNATLIPQEEMNREPGSTHS